MKDGLRYVLLVGLSSLLLVLVACEQAPEPQRIGVFAASNRGLLELTAYGEQAGFTTYSFHKTKDVTLAGKITAFYVNMPDTKITGSKVFWVAKLEENFNSDSNSPLNMSIETGKNNTGYRLTSSDLGSKKGGFALLKIEMPLGTPDRMYVIQVSE